MTPAPLTPSEADLQDFPFMPLHVARLRDSDLAAEGEPEGCWHAVLLWCASWHQLPAGSLPDNDAVLARLCGLGRDTKRFRRHRADALRGWILCNDGRLYHPVVAEQVVAAWDSKLRQRHRTLCAAIRKHNERNPDGKRDTPDFDAWASLARPATMAEYVTALSRVTDGGQPRDIASEREGQGQGQGDSSSDANASGAAPPPLPVDPVKVMFDSGVALLVAAGVDAAKARRQIGRWRADHGTEAVIAALGRAQREGAIDPIAFINGVLRHDQRNRSGGRAGRGHPGGRSGAAGRAVFGGNGSDDDQ